MLLLAMALSAFLCFGIVSCGPTEPEEKVTLSGTVVDESGAAASGATVSLTANGSTTTTGADGSFSFELPDGAVNDTIAVSLSGYATSKVPVSTYNRQNISIILAKLKTVLSGTVLDAAGAALSGAQLSLAVAGSTTASGTDGAFSFSLDPSTAKDTISVSLTGYFPSVVPVSKYDLQNVAIALSKVQCPDNPKKPNPLSINDPVYAVISPNGGEVFYISDSITIVCSSERSGQAEFKVWEKDGLVSIAQFGTSGVSIGAGDTVTLRYWLNPQVFTPSDSLTIQVNTYNGPGEEESDCYFSIREKPEEI